MSKYIIKQSKIELNEIKFLKTIYLNFKSKNKISKKYIFISIDSRHDLIIGARFIILNLIQQILKKNKINKIFINFDPSKIKKF